MSAGLRGRESQDSRSEEMESEGIVGSLKVSRRKRGWLDGRGWMEEVKFLGGERKETNRKEWRLYGKWRDGEFFFKKEEMMH